MVVGVSGAGQGSMARRLTEKGEERRERGILIAQTSRGAAGPDKDTQADYRKGYTSYVRPYCVPAASRYIYVDDGYVLATRGMRLLAETEHPFVALFFLLFSFFRGQVRIYTAILAPLLLFSLFW